VDQEHKTLYSFGGLLSADGHIKDTQANYFYEDRLASIWSLSLAKSRMARTWWKIAGKNAALNMPPNFQQPACGAYTYDSKHAYYTGGYISHWTTFDIINISTHLNVPGMLVFDFATKQLTNSTNDGDYFASRSSSPNEKYSKAGAMFNAPFGPHGIVVSFGGRMFTNTTDNKQGAGWSNVWIFDQTTNKSYYQPTTGDVPSAGLEPDRLAFFYATDEKLKTFDM
jgi:hypothetical protein